ncbi:hypothetical protein F4777DRAFT_558257 [Nemania sp. FL0916]|nr:hypothetical protein F4777DRAFT_558257 [Nemania sp. FL0916]
MMKSLATAAAFFASAVLSAPTPVTTLSLSALTNGTFTNVPLELTIGTNFTLTWESDLDDTVYLAWLANGLKPYGTFLNPLTGQYVDAYYSYTDWLGDHLPATGSFTFTVTPLPDYTGTGLKTWGPDYEYRFGIAPTHVGDGFGSAYFTLVEP